MEAEHHTGDALENAGTHGVTFAEARQAFFDPFRQSGSSSAAGESFVLGYSLAERLLLVIYAERPHTARILAARPATREERRRYERA